jgi:hypothetical protein
LKFAPDVFADALVPSEPGKSLPAFPHSPDIDGRLPRGATVRRFGNALALRSTVIIRAGE